MQIIKDKEIEGDFIYNGRVVFENDCVVNGNIDVGELVAFGNLEIRGGISAESIRLSPGKRLKVEGNVEVLFGIWVPEGLIQSGGDIKAGTFINAKEIKAREISAKEQGIEAEKIEIEGEPIIISTKFVPGLKVLKRIKRLRSDLG